MDDRVVVDRFLMTSWVKVVFSVVEIGVDVVLDEECLLLWVFILFELDVAMHHKDSVASATTFGGL